MRLEAQNIDSESSIFALSLSIIVAKVSYFFFPEKFVFVHFQGEIEWMNENAVVFFPAPGRKKNSFEIEWMNGLWTFPGKKNTEKKNIHWNITHNTKKLCKNGKIGSKITKVITYFKYNTKNAQISDAKSMLRI